MRTCYTHIYFYCLIGDTASEIMDSLVGDVIGQDWECKDRGEPRICWPKIEEGLLIEKIEDLLAKERSRIY